MTSLRIERLLSNLGYGSRKEVTLLMKKGVVRADGRKILQVGRKIDPAQESVTVNDLPLDPLPPLTLVLNKPAGVVCDNVEESLSVFHLLPDRWRRRHPGFSCAGRLDKDSRGLTVLSEDGQLVHRLTSPRNHVPKTYRVVSEKPLQAGDIAAFKSGSMVLRHETKPLKAASCEKLDDTIYLITLFEGRNRQIRRMYATRGHAVIDLQRVGIGGFFLDETSLPENSYHLVDPALFDTH